MSDLVERALARPQATRLRVGAADRLVDLAERLGGLLARVRSEPFQERAELAMGALASLDAAAGGEAR